MCPKICHLSRSICKCSHLSLEINSITVSAVSFIVTEMLRINLVSFWIAPSFLMIPLNFLGPMFLSFLRQVCSYQCTLNSSLLFTFIMVEIKLCKTANIRKINNTAFAHVLFPVQHATLALIDKIHPKINTFKTQWSQKEIM